MNDHGLTLPGGAGELASFNPVQTRPKLRQLDVLIEQVADEARRGDIRNWPLLEAAAKAKYTEVVEFIGWWKHHITGNRHNINPPPENADPHFLSATQATTQTGIRQDQVSRWTAEIARGDYCERIILAARRKAGLEPEANHRAEGTGEFEWYTPPRYIQAARDVMGGIELDPASHEIAQRTVQADRYFTIADDGLRQEWHGRIWLNPPYAQPAIEHFAQKMVTEVNAGHVTEAIMLTHNYTDTAWFHIAASVCDMVCFTRGRIRFINQAGEEADSPTQGQAFFYYGGDCQKFAAVFARFGLLVQPWGN